jgi:hypothetical protein
LRRVDVDEDAALSDTRRRLDDRLHGADLMVGPLHVDERGVGADRGSQRIDIDTTDAIDGNDDRRRRRGPRPRGPRVFDRGEDLMRAPRRGTPARRRDRLGRAGVKTTSREARAEQLGHLLAGLLDGDSGPHPFGVNA